MSVHLSSSRAIHVPTVQAAFGNETPSATRERRQPVRRMEENQTRTEQEKEREDTSTRGNESEDGEEGQQNKNRKTNLRLNRNENKNTFMVYK